MPALPLALFPSVSHAEAGELGGIAMAALTVASVFWVVMTLVVFALLLRRMPMPKRLAFTVLFFFLPALLLGGELLKEYALDGYSGRDEVTTQPLVVLGVTFLPEATPSTTAPADFSAGVRSARCSPFMARTPSCSAKCRSTA